MCLTASADERLACIMQTSFHSTTSFMNPFLATMAQNWIIANSLLTYTTGPLTFLFHLISHTTTEHYLRFSCIHLQTFCFQPWFPFYYTPCHQERSSHLHTVIPEANPVPWKVYFTITLKVVNQIPCNLAYMSKLNVKIINFAWRRCDHYLVRFWESKLWKNSAVSRHC